MDKKSSEINPNTDKMEHIKKRIEDRMSELGIKQEKLGEIADVSQSTVHRMLKTPTSSRIDTLVKVSNALKIPLEYLIINYGSKETIIYCDKLKDILESGEVEDIKAVKNLIDTYAEKIEKIPKDASLKETGT